MLKWIQSHRKVLIISGLVLGCSVLTFSILSYFNQVDGGCKKVSCISLENGLLKKSTPSPTPEPTATPKLSASHLDGTLVADGLENEHPLAVMIENHPEARPQSGLGQASVVYEALAEGGISRFMAIYGNPENAIKVGPVRSARPYYVDIATELNAFYAHVGGSTEALAQIKSTGVLDLNQFGVGAPTYAREPKAGIAIEHTMYSSTEKLWKYATDHNKWSKDSTYQPWVFRTDDGTPTATSTQTIDVNLSSESYRVMWKYAPTTNSYQRSMAGTPHIDANTSTVIAPKNLILQTVARELIEVKDGVNGWHMTLTGTGKATIFQNGVVSVGTWKKEGANRTRYFDAAGKEVSFIPGLTWITLVHPDTPITY